MNQPMLWGVGTSAYGLFPERRIESLAWDAVAEAIRDAGVSPAQVDAMVVGSVFGPPGVATRVQRGLGIGGIPTWTIENACASGTSAYHEAVEAVRLGRFGCVLVLGVEQMSTLFSGAIVPEATDPEGASSLPLPGLYALQAQRYMQEFAVTPEQLASVAVKNKRNGVDNPRAQLRAVAPTLAEVLASRMIAEPLTLLQCCPTSDGAGAAIVGPDRGQAGDLVIEASAMFSGMLWDQRNDEVWGYSPVVRAAEQAFAQAGRMPADIDVLEVHDAFTIGEVITLEALGLAPRGKGAELAPSGYTARDGTQPVNPSGGLLSRGHPLGATGLAQIAEIAWQLRGRAGARQVARHRTGLVETMGGGAAGMDGNACVVTIMSAPELRPLQGRHLLRAEGSRGRLLRLPGQAAVTAQLAYDLGFAVGDDAIAWLTTLAEEAVIEARRRQWSASGPRRTSTRRLSRSSRRCAPADMSRCWHIDKNPYVLHEPEGPIRPTAQGITTVRCPAATGAAFHAASASSRG